MNILNKINIVLTLLILCVSAGANGQVVNNNFWVKSNKIQIDKDTVILVSSSPFNSFSFQMEEDVLGTIKVQTSLREVTLSKDEHVTLENKVQSNLIVCAEDNQTIMFISNGYRGQINWVTQYVKPLTSHNSITTRRAACVLPNMVMQSTWRAGLPDPVPGRNKTPTEHCIIHHSADGNGNSDYTSLVRAYYTHHTQTNGWDDIGYNYLIADDGTLYAGRDPELTSIDQDNVQGAHFCGKNQLTMGVCIIGEYSSVEPSFAAINTLTTLLTWKLDKEQFTVNDSFPHPTATDPLLSVIDGHRSACSTTCPGDNLWSHIPTIRQDVHNKLDQCSTVGIMEESNGILVSPNPSNGAFKVTLPSPIKGSLVLRDITGKIVLHQSVVNASQIEVISASMQAGTYFLEIESSTQTFHQKIVIQK